MNKAIMIPIQPKWSNMIKDGLKKFEFRNYAIPKGTKVYLYESLGKSKPKHLWESYPLYIGFDTTIGKYADNVFEGQGAVVAEFVVGECYEIEFKEDGTPYKEMWHDPDGDWENISGETLTGKTEDIIIWREYGASTGYTNQKYAMEIKDLIVYDEEWQMSQYEIPSRYNGLPIDEVPKEETNRIHKLVQAPEEPLDISEFVGWNKMQKKIKDNPKAEYSIHNNVIGHTWKPEFEGDYSDWFSTKQCNLTSSPQEKVYVVERE